MIPFAHRGGQITARFSRGEAELVRELVRQLVGLLETRMPPRARPGSVLFDDAGLPVGSPLVLGTEETASSDPALARLLPDAYRDDPEASADHRRLTEAGLVARKVSNAQRVLESLATGSVRLDETDALAWLQVLTDLRLALAARFGIEHDGDTGDDPELQAVFDWLGWVQGSLVDAVDR